MKKRSGPLVLKRPSLDLFDDADKITEEDECETSQELPTFKPVNLSKNDLFFDAEKGQYVKLDNFAFAGHTNHFEDKCQSGDDTSSSLALLDSRIFDETTTNSCLDDSKIIVEELKRNIEYCSSTNDSLSQPNSLDVSFETNQPKIKSSPRESKQKRRKSSTLRKLSSESEKLPSKESSSSCENKYAKQAQKPCKLNSNSQVRRRLSLDKSAKRLGQNKSHSATNLHKISVKDYHESFQLRRTSAATDPEPDKSASYDSLYHLSWKELAGKKADYSHVQSKVRQYIHGDGASSRPSSRQDRRKNSDFYGKSFVLSPGRKSLSMSNIVQDDKNWLQSRRSSVKSELKSFLSAKNLDDLHISVKNTTKSRESLLLYDQDRISRLLEDVSDHEEAGNTAEDATPSEVVVEVEDLLHMAMEERRGKLEAKTCLAELQMKHDELQKKYAAAEITIDNMRFGAPEETNADVGAEESSQEVQKFDSSLSHFHKELSDIQEQLYGLELLSSNASSFTSIEKKSILTKLKSNFETIQGQMKMVDNVELAQLLSEVGDKLARMETFQESDGYDDFVKNAQVVAQSSEELDPIEKVTNWRTDVQKNNGGKGVVATSTGYYSNSTSPTPIKNSERSSFEQGSSPVELDSGCPGSERSPMTNTVLIRHLSHVAEEQSCTSSEKRFHTITDLSSDEQIDEEIAKMKQNLTNTSGATAATTTPRGTNAIWAQQIEQEVLELRNLYEDHREEMMHILSHEKSKQVTSTGCSPINFCAETKSLNSPRKSRMKKSTKIPFISDSEDNHNLQEERRQEFEKFKKKKMKNKQNQSNVNTAPKFAIGEPVQDVSISALFPQVRAVQEEINANNDQGRHVATVDGDKVFIPKLNLEDQWSIEENSSKNVPKKRTRKNKKDLKAFLDNLQLANQLAAQLKQRSQVLLSELQCEIENV